MNPQMSPELKKLKDEFDFLHKKIGELYWEKATIWYGRKAILRSDIDRIDEQIQNYSDNINIVLEKAEEASHMVKETKKKPQPKSK